MIDDSIIRNDILIWFLFGSPPGFIIENDSLTDWCSMILPLRWFHFNIKQTAGIVMIDLQQLWPAHRNDALKKRACIFARLRRVPAVWCSKDDTSEWYQLNIRQSAEKGPVKVSGSLSDYDRRYGMTAKNDLPFQRRRRRLKLLRRRIFYPVETFFKKYSVFYLPTANYCFILPLP